MPILDLDDPRDRVLPHVLRRQATLRPDQPFVLSDDLPGGHWTFREVDRRSDAIATGLADLGVSLGDNVALLMGNCPEQLPITFGINRLGAVWTPINPEYRGRWLADSLADSQATVLFTDANLLKELAPLLPELDLNHVVVRGPSGVAMPLVHVHDLAELLTGTGVVPQPQLHYGSTAAILWTSGTTGRAKGVMQPHNAWIRSSLSGALSAHTEDDDVLYCCLPMHNSAAWIGVVYRALVAGVPFGLDPRFSAGAFWGRIRHFGATQAFTLGAMHVFLWQADPRSDDRDNRVRCFGAIPMPDALLAGFKERFGVTCIQQGYGQSELMGFLSRIDDGTTSWNPGSVGLPLAGVDVALLDDEDREVASGETGEFCARPTEAFVTFNGYYNDEATTLRSFRNLWYHTGDLGRRDDDGQYHFVDRKADYIRHKGRSISSFAVEASLRAHPEVAAVAAFGVRSAELESEAEVMVAVVPVPGATPDPAALARFVNEHNPYYLVPRYIDLVDDLPYTPTQKVKKHELRDRGVSDRTWDRDASGFVVQR